MLKPSSSTATDGTGDVDVSCTAGSAGLGFLVSFLNAFPRIPPLLEESCLSLSRRWWPGDSGLTSAKEALREAGAAWSGRNLKGTGLFFPVPLLSTNMERSLSTENSCMFSLKEE